MYGVHKPKALSASGDYIFRKWIFSFDRRTVRTISHFAKCTAIETVEKNTPCVPPVGNYNGSRAAGTSENH